MQNNSLLIEVSVGVGVWYLHSEHKSSFQDYQCYVMQVRLLNIIGRVFINKIIAGDVPHS